MIQEASTDKKHVIQLVDLCQQKGIRHVVISPGSRNAPLAIAFNRAVFITTHVVVDERCAAFFALGIAQRLNEPVAVVCTSGTALLNHMPAVAEAYYQQIPLLVISADRPQAWIDQDDSQTIRQPHALANCVKGSFQLHETVSDQELLWHNNRMINQAINLALHNRKGPVHINVPLKEPLCGLAPISPSSERIIRFTEPTSCLSSDDFAFFHQQIQQSRKILIVASVNQPNDALLEAVIRLSHLPQAMVLAESVSNLSHSNFINHIDRTLSKMDAQQRAALAPDLLITFGGPVISKFLKQWIRSLSIPEHWHIAKGESPIDTYCHLTEQVCFNPESFFTALPEISALDESTYQASWISLQEKADHLHASYSSTAPWSDFKAFEAIMEALPPNSCLHLSNGTSVRYHQLFQRDESIAVYANRGTSGIDGSTSTAMGAASVMPHPTTCITGDISFLYDSNAMWQEQLPKNIRIIILNNQGGGIFRFISGPSGLSECERFFETPPQVDIAALSKAYNFAYFQATSEEDLPEQLQNLYAAPHAAILEIVTPRTINDTVLRNYFKYNNGK